MMIRVAHRLLWQNLPHQVRRSILFNMSARLAPLPDAVSGVMAPLIVAGVLRSSSGLGESARLCHDALKTAGFSAFGYDLTETLMQPLDKPGFTFADASTLAGSGTLILHVNAPFLPLAMLRIGRRLVQDKRIIAYWHWELPDVPPEWRHGIRFVHEIWVPSRFVAEAIQPIADGRPIRVIPHPVSVGQVECETKQRTQNEPFTVLTMFNMASSFARKNPCASIDAFGAAFGNNPAMKLVVKVSNGMAFPHGLRQLVAAQRRFANISLINETMTPVALNALYAAADVVLSLHRAEGFGLTLAEAMLRGLPVIATGWSGNMDFMTQQNSIPVPYKLVPAVDPQGTYNHPTVLWAEPDISAASEALRQLHRDRNLRIRLGSQAKNDAKRLFGADHYSAAMREHILRTVT